MSDLRHFEDKTDCFFHFISKSYRVVTELELGTQCVVEMEGQQTVLQYPQSHDKERTLTSILFKESRPCYRGYIEVIPGQAELRISLEKDSLASPNDGQKGSMVV
ncbi:hypothetical protein RR46_12093 [Papilio xuthus]|uniref:Uncharacterized protein n=1 Tax=Papilio xuthus TaxID=66420 RepID=A0A194PQS0_PAPXU|nr:hypothetical protein RR46_12093 [Papilio xuthus]